jgi:hypothetical protein
LEETPVRASIDIRRELEEAISADKPLPAIVERLREYRGLGVSREEVQSALESLRAEARDEAVEDRILEVMDFVAGFCRPEDVVWDH